MTVPKPLLTQTLQTLGITTAALAAGSNIMTSAYAVPAILLSPPKLQAKQWLEMYNRGILIVVPLSLASASIFAYLSYLFSGRPSRPNTSITTSQGYALASAAAFGFLPFTRLLMWETNGALQRLGGGEGVFEEGAVRVLVERWGSFNLWRGMLPLTATVLATWVSVGR